MEKQIHPLSLRLKQHLLSDRPAQCHHSWHPITGGPRSLSFKAKAFPGPEATSRQGAFGARVNCYPPWAPRPHTQTKDSVCVPPPTSTTPYRLQAQGRNKEGIHGLCLDKREKQVGQAVGTGWAKTYRYQVCVQSVRKASVSQKVKARELSGI